MKHQQPATGGPRPARAKSPAHGEALADGAAEAFEAESEETRDAFIRSAAYSFYEARGCVDGHDLEDWLQAEAQFEASHRRAKRPAPAGPARH